MEPARPSRLTEGKSPCTSPGASLTKMRELEPSQHSPRRQGSRTMSLRQMQRKQAHPSLFLFFVQQIFAGTQGGFLGPAKMDGA